MIRDLLEKLMWKYLRLQGLWYLYQQRKFFARWLYLERLQRGWSQSDLAFRARLGRQVVANLEAGIWMVYSTRQLHQYSSVLRRLSEALNVHLSVVLQAAGLLPGEKAEEIEFEDWFLPLAFLDEGARERVRQMYMNQSNPG